MAVDFSTMSKIYINHFVVVVAVVIVADDDFDSSVGVK